MVNRMSGFAEYIHEMTIFALHNTMGLILLCAYECGIARSNASHSVNIQSSNIRRVRFPKKCCLLSVHVKGQHLDFAWMGFLQNL